MAKRVRKKKQNTDMKYYTTPEQTNMIRKLTHMDPLGWSIDGLSDNYVMRMRRDDMCNYSIGELFGLLPANPFVRKLEDNSWQVIVHYHYDGSMDCVVRPELVEALAFAVITSWKNKKMRNENKTLQGGSSDVQG